MEGFLWSHTNLHVTLSAQVVNLCWPRLTDDLHQTHAVCQIAIVQLHVCQREPKPHTDPLFSKAKHINKQSCFCLTGDEKKKKCFKQTSSHLITQHMMTCLVTVKTLEKQISSLKIQIWLAWTNQDTYCLRCESLGSGKDAQCDQCWMSLNDGWYREPARKKKKFAHLLIGFYIHITWPFTVIKI